MNTQERVRRLTAEFRGSVHADGKEIGPVSSRVFDALNGGSVSEATWLSIGRRAGADDEMLRNVITRISAAGQRAKLSSPEGRMQVQEFPGRYQELLQCAIRLRDEFPRADNDQFREFHKSIAWAVGFLDAFGPSAAEALFDSLPRSRKGCEKVAFEKHLCEEFEAMFGTPLYEVVADLSNVLYRDDREATKDLVAKNYQAERAARQVG